MGGLLETFSTDRDAGGGLSTVVRRAWGEIPWQEETLCDSGDKGYSNKDDGYTVGVGLVSGQQ